MPFTATMVVRTRLNITSHVQCLSCINTCTLCLERDFTMVWCSDYHFRENVNSEEVSDNVFFFICLYALKNKKRRVTAFNSNPCLVHVYVPATWWHCATAAVIVWTGQSLFLGASSPLCYKQLGRGWGTSKHNCFVSYLLWWRYVSATVDHLQVTKMYIEENYIEYDYIIGAYSKLPTRCG